MRRLLVALILILGAPIAGAQEQTAVSPALQAQMEQIEAQTRALRGLDELAPVERRFPTRSAVQTYLMDTLDVQLDEQAAWAETQFYAAFDLLPADVDLRQTYLDLLGSQVAGFYDPETKQMNVILVSGEAPGERLPLMEQIVYSHEYVHALQDQHFGLREIGLDPEQLDVTGDRLLALQALIEGDATVVMNEYTLLATQENPLGGVVELLFQGMQTGGLTLPPGTPAIIGAELLFPYFDGLSFVLALRQEGGWERVNQAYADPPSSTEQILHPRRYLDGDLPREVSLRGAAPLGADWEAVLDRTLGEFYLRQYLRTQLPSTEANKAAEGWGGDRFRIYYSAQTDRRAWVLKLVWDNAQEAAEFASIYVEFGGARFESSSQAAQSVGGLCWSNAAESLCMTAGQDSTLLAFAPTQDLALSLIEAQR